jgi:zinc/manganese transport system permease protein
MEDLIFSMFSDYGFMRRALVACILLSLSAAPIGSFLVLRRMSLIGDTMAHAIMPGVAIAYIMFGLSSTYMSIGGFISGILIALLAGAAAKRTKLFEDATFASFYLISIALGACLISMYGSNTDLLGVLFGTLLGIPDNSLYLIAAISGLTLLTLAIIYRPLVAESFDPNFIKLAAGRGSIYYLIYLVLLVLNLIAAYQALGTLLAVGLLILPPIIAKLWCKRLLDMMLTSAGVSILTCTAGLICSYHYNLPAGPTIILLLGGIYIISLGLHMMQHSRNHRAFTRFSHRP